MVDVAAIMLSVPRLELRRLGMMTSTGWNAHDKPERSQKFPREPAQEVIMTLNIERNGPVTTIVDSELIERTRPIR